MQSTPSRYFMLSLSLVRLMLSVEVGVTTAMSGDRRSRNFYDIKERTVQGVREVLQKSLRQPINLSQSAMVSTTVHKQEYLKQL